MTQAQPYNPEACGALVVRLAGIVTTTGLVVGVVAGWYGLAGADDPTAIAQRVARVFPALGLLLPAALYALATPAAGALTGSCYGTTRRALGILGAAGALGAIGGILLFIVACFQIPSIFGDQPIVEVIGAMRDSLLWGPTLAVLGANAIGTVLVAVIVGRKR